MGIGHFCGHIGLVGFGSCFGSIARIGIDHFVVESSDVGYWRSRSHRSSIDVPLLALGVGFDGQPCTCCGRSCLGFGKRSWQQEQILS